MEHQPPAAAFLAEHSPANSPDSAFAPTEHLGVPVSFSVLHLPALEVEHDWPLAVPPQTEHATSPLLPVVFALHCPLPAPGPKSDPTEHVPLPAALAEHFPDPPELPAFAEHSAPAAEPALQGELLEAAEHVPPELLATTEQSESPESVESGVDLKFIIPIEDSKVNPSPPAD